LWSPPAVPGLRFVRGEATGDEAGDAAAERFTDAVRLFDGRVLVATGEVFRSGSAAVAAADALRRTIRGAAEVLADPLAILAAADRAVRDDPSQPGAAACVGIYDPIALTFAVASAGAAACSLRGPERIARVLGAPGPALGKRRPGDAEPTELAMVPGLRLTLAAGGTQLLHLDVASEDPGDPRSPLRRSFETFDAGAVLRARAEVVATILAAGATQAEAGDAETVFGELVGNVVRHAPGICEIALDRAGPMPVLSVLDRGRGRGLTHTAMLRADAFAESGRGLFIARALALEFNAFPRAGGGTHVRAVLSASARPAGGSVTAA
jgi:anti-sigma regulatory factor (Ser/Thr protein kinase)